MAKYQAECIQLLQEATNLLNASQQWENHAHVRAQRIGLQGEKRRGRYDERKDLCLMQYLQSVAADVFDAEIIPEVVSVAFPQITKIPDYFKAYQLKLWETYESLHAIANELVVKGISVLLSRFMSTPDVCSRRLLKHAVQSRKASWRRGNTIMLADIRSGMTMCMTGMRRKKRSRGISIRDGSLIKQEKILHTIKGSSCSVGVFLVLRYICGVAG